MVPVDEGRTGDRGVSHPGPCGVAWEMLSAEDLTGIRRLLPSSRRWPSRRRRSPRRQRARADSLDGEMGVAVARPEVYLVSLIRRSAVLTTLGKMFAP